MIRNARFIRYPPSTSAINTLLIATTSSRGRAFAAEGFPEEPSLRRFSVVSLRPRPVLRPACVRFPQNYVGDFCTRRHALQLLRNLIVKIQIGRASCRERV